MNAFGITQVDGRQVRGLETSMEHVLTLLNQEDEVYGPCDDYLNSSQGSSMEPVDFISEAWRRKLCEWCYEVVDHFNFDREAVAYALNFLDRTVAWKAARTGQPPGKREYQLLAVTSLYLAIKLHGETDATQGPRRKLRIDAFVELSRGLFQINAIEETERLIFIALDWRVNPPTCLRFISNLLRLCPRWTRIKGKDCGFLNTNCARVLGGIFDVARYLTELSVCVSAFTFKCKTSMIAYAAILCAVDVLQEESLSLPQDVKATFFARVATASSLHPNDEEVLHTKAMLKDLCPSMFLDNEVPSEFLVDRSGYFGLVEEYDDDDRVSPVCVIDAVGGAPLENHQAPRKRSRSSNTDVGGSHPH